MTIKTILPTWLGVALMCLIFSPALAQTQAEASESYLHLEQGQKQKTIEPGDHVNIRTDQDKRRIKGTLYHVTDSTLVLRGKEVPIASIQKMRVQKRKPRKLALWLLVGVLLSPIIIGLLLTIIIAVFPIRQLRNDFYFWINVRRASGILSWLALIGAAVATIFSRRWFNLKKWKVKVKKRPLEKRR